MKLKISGENLAEFEKEIENNGLLTLWNKFQNKLSNGVGYDKLIEWQDKFKPLGLTFDFGLDADPYDFELIEAGITEGNILYLDRVKTWVLEYDIVYHKDGTMSVTRIPIANFEKLDVSEHSNKTKVNFEIVDKRALIDISTLSTIKDTDLFEKHFAQAKKEILSDMKNGIVPETIKEFGDLHSYVDANYYGGFCDEDYTASENFELENKVQNAVNDWLKTR